MERSLKLGGQLWVSQWPKHQVPRHQQMRQLGLRVWFSRAGALQLTIGLMLAPTWDNIRRRSFGEGQEWMDPGVDADIIPGDGNDTWIDAETSGPELIRYMLSVGLNQGLYAFSSPNLGN